MLKGRVERSCQKVDGKFLSAEIVAIVYDGGKFDSYIVEAHDVN